MDLQSMTAKVRPRKAWEAIDLGVLLVQQHAKALYQIWFLVTFPIFLLGALLFIDYSIWPYFGFWLLKPLWERPLLHFLSRELFGERLSVKDCVKAFFQLAKIQWFASLTWRRLSFTRSLDLPIIQLEGLSGVQRSQRMKVIHSLGSGSTVWMTVLFVCLEIIFYAASLTLAFLFMPVQWIDSFDLWDWFFAQSDVPGLDFLMNLVSYLAVSLVAPFFTACGFTLYLNQRTQLEAWDIELAFKRLAKRLTEISGPVVRLASLVGIAVLLAGFWPMQPVNAAEDTVEVAIEADALPDSISETESEHQQARQLIHEVKQDPIFNQKETRYRYQPKDFKTPDETPEIKSGSFSSLFYLLGKVFSVVIEFALWVVLAVVIIFLLTRYGYLIKGLKAPPKSSKHRPRKLFGLDMSQESLPDKPWLVALSLVERQQFREATSLLYRASLIWFIEHSSVLIKEGDTELECLVKIEKLGFRSSTPQKSSFNFEATEFVRRITHQWRGLAYAHQQPDKTVLLSFCEEWPKIFLAPDSEMEKVSD